MRAPVSGQWFVTEYCSLQYSGVAEPSRAGKNNTNFTFLLTAHIVD